MGYGLGLMSLRGQQQDPPPAKSKIPWHEGAGSCVPKKKERKSPAKCWHDRAKRGFHSSGSLSYFPLTEKRQREIDPCPLAAFVPEEQPICPAVLVERALWSGCQAFDPLFGDWLLSDSWHTCLQICWMHPLEIWSKITYHVSKFTAVS